MGKPRLTLAQKLNAFGTAIHGAQPMVSGRVCTDPAPSGLNMTHASSNEKNPFAERFVSRKGEVCYVLPHQPKSFAWRDHGARPRLLKQVPPTVFESACEVFNGIISIGVRSHTVITQAVSWCHLDGDGNCSRQMPQHPLRQSLRLIVSHRRCVGG